MDIKQLFAANLGKKVETAAGQMTIDSFLEKFGTMKSGERAPYVHMIGDTGIVDLHPEKARQLFAKGEFGAMRILTDIAAEPVAAEAVTTPEVVAEAAPVAATPAAEAAAPADATPVVAKKETSKDATLRIYREMNVDGKQRKEIIARMRTELGMSVPGANTYYQNVKSGMWK